MEFNFLKPRKKKKKSTNGYSILMTANEFEFLMQRDSINTGGLPKII